MSKNAPTYAAITRQIWWDLFNQFRHDIPDRFTEKEAQELLGVTETGARDVVLPWLKQVGLLNDNNRVNKVLAKDWMKAEQHAIASWQMIENAYPAVARKVKAAKAAAQSKPTAAPVESIEQVVAQWVKELKGLEDQSRHYLGETLDVMLEASGQFVKTPHELEYWKRLADWPFAYQRAFTQPAPHVIEQHALGHLSRALNIGRVTAFVGSGVSMAYGRISWKDLLRFMQQWACEKASRISDPRVAFLRKLLTELSSNKNQGQQLGLFQVAESLATIVEEHDGGRKSELSPFDRRLMNLAYDRRGLIVAQLSTLRDAGVISEKLLFELADQLFRFPFAPDRNASENENEKIHTDKAIRKFNRSSKLGCAYGGDAIFYYRTTAQKIQNIATKGATRPVPEPILADPIRNIFEQLEIKRFVTTNYDTEIEKFLAKRKLWTSWSPKDSRDGQLQPVASLLDFTADDTGRLTAMLSRDRSRQPWVIHLHGRATVEGKGRLVATEEHYRERYIRNDRTRVDVDSAMRMIYGASPILFVGVGMSEVDLLHPLRQLLSTPARVGDRIAIALMPASGTPEENDSQQIELLTKYGVYSIFYGKELLHAGWYISDVISKIGRVKDDYLTAVNAAVGEKKFQEAVKILDGAKSSSEAMGQVIGDLQSAIQIIRKSSTHDWAADVLSRGAYNALNSVLLCEKIQEVADEWQTWWTKFRQLPLERQATATADATTGVVQRHAMTTTLNNEEKLEQRRNRKAARLSALEHRFAKATWSHALDSIVRSLYAKEVRRTARGVGRMFLFIAPRGAGKGHLMSAIQNGSISTEPSAESVLEGKTISDLLAALGSWDYTRTRRSPVATYNLGYTIEVSSVIDSISLFLWGIADEQTEENRVSWESFAYDRIGRLRFALSLFRLIHSDPRPIRPLIILNAANVLFDGHGISKNPQLSAVMEVFREQLATCSVDIIMIVTPRTAPAIFRSRVSRDWRASSADRRQKPSPVADSEIVTASGEKVVWLSDPVQSKQRENRTIGQMKRLGLEFVVEELQTVKTRAIYYAHWLKRVHPCVIMTAYYPTLACALAIALTPYAIPLSPSPNLIIDLKPKNIRDSHETGFGEPEGDTAAQTAINLLGFNVGLKDPWVAKICEFTRRLKRAAGGGRWPLTVLLSGVEATVKEGFTADSAPDLGVYARLEGLCASFERVPKDRRVDVVISSALDIMREGNNGGELHDAILWHLAVIGQPVEFEVLIQCPDIIAASCNRKIRSGKSADVRCVAEALRALLRRSLILEMKPSYAYASAQSTAQGGATAHASASATTDTKSDTQAAAKADAAPVALAGSLDANTNGNIVYAQRPRYCIHRLMQRHILRRLGAPYAEQPDVDRLSLTMYASQPNDMAAVAPEVHKRLSEAVETLSGYPDHDDAAERFEHHGLIRQSQMLRAAYGILRNTYSVASVVRYRINDQTLDSGRQSEYDPGLIELHRHQLRWLLQKSGELFPKFPTSKPSSKPPFYAEEIAWLYNESGVLSLVQGQLKDALALFQLADRTAEAFEDDVTGPVRSIIALNTAITNIERGVLMSAKAALELIVDANTRLREQRSSDIVLICRGYLGVIAHLTGYATEAKRIFEAVIPKLTGRSLSRAASIFARFQGDLLRGQRDTAGAADSIDKAIRLAAEDHHEDVRQVALLAKARLQLDTENKNKSTEIHSLLDGVEAYARRMGIAKLTCKALETRARLHQHNGDLRTATTLASAALEIASQNELRVRKAALLVLMAELAERRGMIQNAQEFLNAATTLAEDIHYHSAVVGAQRVADRIGAARLGS